MKFLQNMLLTTALILPCLSLNSAFAAGPDEGEQSLVNVKRLEIPLKKDNQEVSHSKFLRSASTKELKDFLNQVLECLVNTDKGLVSAIYQLPEPNDTYYRMSFPFQGNEGENPVQQIRTTFKHHMENSLRIVACSDRLGPVFSFASPNRTGGAVQVDRAYYLEKIDLPALVQLQGKWRPRNHGEFPEEVRKVIAAALLPLARSRTTTESSSSSSNLAEEGTAEATTTTITTATTEATADDGLGEVNVGHRALLPDGWTAKGYLNQNPGLSNLFGRDQYKGWSHADILANHYINYGKRGGLKYLP